MVDLLTFTHLDSSITACCQERNLTADDCVEEMRSKVREETGLTVSAGIAPNTVRLTSAFPVLRSRVCLQMLAKVRYAPAVAIAQYNLIYL
jgi:hypothetical protein